MLKANKYQKKYSRKKVPVFKLNAFLAVLWLFAIIAYLAILNNITVNGYKMKKIESRLIKLEAENKDLGLNFSNKQSMERVMTEMKSLGMIDSGSTTYLMMPSTAIVRK